jgi:tRNA (guanine-N7-)-methyltransferase
MTAPLILTYSAMRLPWPTPWENLFGRPAPLGLEIGFGNGVFLADLARKEPHTNWLGIEIAHAPLLWTENRLRRLGLENVRLLHGEAFMILHCLFTPASLETVHINFSDPWHKKRHHERRLVDAPFLRLLVSRLRVNASLYIATDIESYAAQIGLALAQTEGLKNATASPWMSERSDPTVMTHYERKARHAGRACFYFHYQRVAPHVPPAPYDQAEDKEILPMPNAMLRLPLSLDEASTRFTPHTLRSGERVARLIRVFREVNAPHLLIEAHIEEPLFSQHLMILVVQRGVDEVLVRLSEVGYPRPTRGVHDAVHGVVMWLLSLHPEAHILQHKLKWPQADEAESS